jgi:excinuclease ABC subunit A
VIVIEHHLDVIKSADHVIDLGPAGGNAGGRIMATGTPEELAKNPKSITGPYLKDVLGRTRRPSVPPQKRAPARARERTLEDA